MGEIQHGSHRHHHCFLARAQQSFYALFKDVGTDVGVYSTERIVQQKHLRVANNSSIYRPGQPNSLFLPP